MQDKSLMTYINLHKFIKQGAMDLAKKSQKATKPQNLQILIPIIGILIVFLSIISLLKWGALGAIFTNFLRLFIGETYPLIMVLFIYIGINMLFKGSIFHIQIKSLLGAFLIFSALSISLHYNEFFPKEPLAQSVFSETYQIFRNEFLANQVELSLGGGLLGALYYQICGYLFGRWGSYLLSVILFSVGLTLVEPYGIKEITQTLKDIFTSIKCLFMGVGDQLNSTRQRVRQKMDEKQTIESAKPQDMSEESRTPISQNRQQPSQNILSKIKDVFQKDAELLNEENYENIDDNVGTESIFISDQRPAMDYNPHRQFDPYSNKDRVARTALQERKKHGGVVLDMDYFEQMYPQETSENIKPHRPINCYNDLQDGKGAVNQSPAMPVNPVPDNDDNYLANLSKKTGEVKTSDANTSEIAIDDQQPKVKDERVSQEKSDQPRKPNSQKDSNLSHSRSQSAGHWQSQAHTHQRLTDDEVELSLSESDKQNHSQESSTNNQQDKEYVLPGKDLLTERPPVDQTEEYERINQNIDKLEQTFKSFGVDATVVKANLGPAVTKYEIEPAVGVKVSKIVSLTDDIALALAARDIRMEAPIPGKSYIGIEVPNTQVSPVSFNEIVDASLGSEHILEVPLGRDVAGAISTADLSKMPHLLIAGSTGSGKSVGMNTIICSLLMKARPEEVKFLMIDPKKVELTMYNDIPHLLSPVVTNPRKAAKALNQVVSEMEERYDKFAKANVRNQESYNEYAERMNQEEGIAVEKMPKIVVFIDELADLMLVAGNEVENSIIRLAQMARAAGIHMIIATQRPSVDVITGIIKANIPSRLAFAVTSGTDSRTILDANGAEKLLGKGDMLFQPISMNKPVRVQGAYISDAEVERITNFIKNQRNAEYDEKMIITDEAMSEAEASEDEYFDEAVDLIKSQDTVSISQIQRKFRVGYNRAARIIDDLEALGYISPADGSKPRQVYINE